MTKDRREEEREEKAPLTGTLDQDDVMRHLATHGPARNDAEREELLAAIDGEAGRQHDESGRDE